MTKRDGYVDVRMLLYSNHKTDSNLWLGWKINKEQKAACWKNFTGGDHLTFKNRKKKKTAHRRGHLVIDQGRATGMDEMKNRSDVTTGRKGKWRQRQALIAR